MILSLDPALNVSGFAIIDEWDNVRPYVKSWGTFQTNPKDKLSDRLDAILKQIETLVDVYKIDKIAFEDVQEQHKNVLTYRRLVSVSTMIEYWCDFTKILWVRMPPSRWRKHITDKTGEKFGRKRVEQKATSVRLAEQYLKSQFNSRDMKEDVTEDAADAIMIGLAAIYGYEFEDKYIESVF